MITYRGQPTKQYEAGTMMKVNVSGLNATISALQQIADAIGENKNKLMENIIFDGVTIAKEEVPVDTGELRDSIHGELNPDGTKGAIVAGTDHAIFVEFGTGLRGKATSPIKNKLVNYVYDYHNREWKGNVANPFMHRTAVRLQEDIRMRGREFLEKVTQ